MFDYMKDEKFFPRAHYSDDDSDSGDYFSSNRKPLSKSKTPMLDNFGRDLTEMAETGKLDPIVGRDHEIERVSQILSRRKKNNPILIGEPGVGKSAIAEGLAIRIVKKKVSRGLYNKRVVSLDLASMVAGTKYRGQFEERMRGLISELENNPNVIIFIDEIHTMVGAGNAGGSLDAANILKPALARGEIQAIGATTLNEYRQHIEKDGALVRRFQTVIVEPANEEETVLILNNIKEKYEDHHLVEYTDEAIKACARLTERYITDRHLPDKAIDALDEAGSRVHMSNIDVPDHIVKIEKEIEQVRESKNEVIKSQQYEKAADLRDKERGLQYDLEEAMIKWEEESKTNRAVVNESHMSEVVSMMSGVPVSKINEGEGAKLSKMMKTLSSKVIGQDEAVERVVNAIQRSRTGLKDPHKPIGSFFFLGSTGVGKTQLTKVLAEYLFDSEDSLIRVDMSEYMEKFSVSKLAGAPPGYVGYDEGGQLTERVRRKPYSIVLLDEIEKAHPDVLNMLLQVLDDGHLTDGLGRKVDFKNTIIIMTSNIGARQLQDFGTGVGFGTKAKAADYDKSANSVIQTALKRAFSPEFLNRVDDLIVFHPLQEEDIKKIIDIELNKLISRINGLGYTLEVSTSAKNYICKVGYDEKFGARPLKRAIQKLMEDPISAEIVKGNLKEGYHIKVDHTKDEDKLDLNIKKSNK